MIALTAPLSSTDEDIDGDDVIVDVMLMIWLLDIDDLVVSWFSSVIALMLHLSCLADVVRTIMSLFVIQLPEYQTDVQRCTNLGQCSRPYNCTDNYCRTLVYTCGNHDGCLWCW